MRWAYSGALLSFFGGCIAWVPGHERTRCVGISGFSPVVGRLMSELVVDGQTTLDITPLRLQRFDESQAITTPYGYGVMG